VPAWEQNYGYDRYGNRTSVTSSGFTAALGGPDTPAQTGPEAQIARALAPTLPDFLRAGADRRELSDGPGPNQIFGAAFAAPLLAAPADLKVTSTADAQIKLTWAATAGAVNYRVEKSTSKNGPYMLAGTSASNAFDDNNVSRGNAYLYRVCAADGAGNCVSPFGNAAVGTAYTFADDPIVTQSDHDNGLNTGQALTKVRALHVAQLREAVNAVRRLAGRADADWTHPMLTPNQTPVTADYVRDLRTALAEALSDLGVAAPSYTDPTLGTGQSRTIIKRAHVAELRLGASRGHGGGGGTGGGQPVPRDGIASVSYAAATNRITLDGYAYDVAGNLTRSAYPYGGWLRFQYDAAGRLAKVKDDLEHTLATYTYDFSSRRLATQHGDEASAARTYYAWAEAGVMAEYREDAMHPTSPAWDRTYIYLSTTLLASHAPGAQGEAVEFYQPRPPRHKARHDALGRGARRTPDAPLRDAALRRSRRASSSGPRAAPSRATTAARTRRSTTPRTGSTTGIRRASRRQTRAASAPPQPATRRASTSMRTAATTR
jgi:YD repeat-containing protein